jgi:tetratricopeptide (TPR) repeat protein
LAQTELDPTFSFNEKSLKDIIDAISLVTKDDLAKLETIDIAGYASPEGDTKQNLELAAGRAKALKDYIIGKFGFAEDMFNVTAGGTDWAGLKELVIKSDMPYKDEIIGIIDNTPEENRQAKIAALAGGRPYKSMRDVLYPQLRDACYIRVWFSEKEDVAAKEINEAIADINAGKHEEALKKLMAHKDDSRAWNAIGCVKALMEDLKQAREWFRKAAEAGDQDAAANLKGIEEILK